MSFPIIITGMHRSGTTMLASMLDKLGLFIGVDRGRNEEALFFLNINEWLMRRAGGAWDYPLPVLKIRENEALHREVLNFMGQMVQSSYFIQFTGIHRWFMNRELNTISWGWKDPRNIFTIDLWSSIYPSAKLLYMQRNGVDVANSLVVRASTPSRYYIKHPFTIMPLRWRLRQSIYPVETYIKSSVRCISLDESFKLWEEYTAEAENQFARYRGEKLVFRYEDLLEEPLSVMRNVLSFCGLDVDDERLNESLLSINKSRKYSFTHDNSLMTFYESVKETALMKSLGYHDICS